MPPRTPVILALCESSPIRDEVEEIIAMAGTTAKKAAAKPEEAKPTEEVAPSSEETVSAEVPVVEESKPSEPVADSGRRVSIRFIESGFTAFGRVWDRDEELVLVEGTAEWNATIDRAGVSWLDKDSKFFVVI